MACLSELDISIRLECVCASITPVLLWLESLWRERFTIGSLRALTEQSMGNHDQTQKSNALPLFEIMLSSFDYYLAPNRDYSLVAC